MPKKIPSPRIEPGLRSVNPPPDRQPSPETQARAVPAREAMRAALRQIQTPEQARKVVEKAMAAARGLSEGQVQAEEEQANHADDTVSERVRRIESAAAELGEEKTAEIILETAREIAGSSGETREALEQASQEATNPRQFGGDDRTLQKPLALLRAELLNHMQPLQALDARLFLAINQIPHPPLANRLMYGLTTVMNGGWGWVLGLLIASVFDKKRGRTALQQVVLPLWFTTMAIEFPVKSFFRRRRPFIDIVQAISVGKKPGTYSFPSGHSASSFAGAWLLRRHYPELTPLWYAIASTVAFSRIYVGAHYPGDVLIGALAGTLIAEGTRLLSEHSAE